MNIESKNCSSNYAHHFVIHWLLKNGVNMNQHQDSYQRETIYDKLYFFAKLEWQLPSLDLKYLSKALYIFKIGTYLSSIKCPDFVWEATPVDHSEQYCAWTMNPNHVHNIIYRS